MKVRITFQGLIFIGSLLVVFCTLLFLYIFLQGFMREYMVDQIRKSLAHEMVVLKEVIKERWYPGASLTLSDKIADDLGGKLGIRVTLIQPDGRVLGDSDVPVYELHKVENHAGRPEVIQAISLGQGTATRRSATTGTNSLYFAESLSISGTTQLIIRMAMPLSQVEMTISRLKRLILIGTAIGLFLSICVAYILSLGISRPVKNLTRAAKIIASGNLSHRARIYPKNELGELGMAFDMMADALQKEIQAVKEAKERLDAILSGMAEGVLMIDREGRILFVNNALKRLLDIKYDPSGRTQAEIFRNACLQDAIHKVLNGEPISSVEVMTFGANQKFFEVTVVGLKDERSQSGAVAVFHDITERKRTEKIRRDFVANVSHELKTPLTSIMGPLELIMDGAVEDPEEARKFLQMIHRNVKRLQKILQDLLDLARVESGEVTFMEEWIQAEELADSLINAAAGLARSKKIEIIKEIPREPISFKGDLRLIEQALMNLMDNAIKYTEPGGQVTLHIGSHEQGVCIEVKDTGIGISPEHIPRIFERFYRVDDARTREGGGTGLGLSIVKHIIQLHRGKIEVDSLPGKGSTFRIIFPL